MSDPTAPQDVPAEDPDTETHGESALEEKQGLLDRFRGTGVGVEDPNIVGDAGPTDVAPGSDPDAAPPGV